MTTYPALEKWIEEKWPKTTSIITGAERCKKREGARAMAQEFMPLISVVKQNKETFEWLYTQNINKTVDRTARIASAGCGQALASLGLLEKGEGK